MAGLGFRTFVSGEVLTAANVNGYLMEQAVMVFASASARTTALPTPSEGMVSYLTDTNATQFYDGAAWVSLISNALVNAKGDLITATANDTPAILTAGSNGQMLMADSSATAGLRYVDPPANRNLIINGAMQVAQRATSASGLTSTGYHTVDRWRSVISSLGTWTQSVENDGPTGSGIMKSLKMLCTTAQASPSAAAFMGMQMRLEGQDLQRVKKGTASAEQLTLSFWVKSNVTGTYVATLTDETNTRQVGATYTVSASGAWERKTITFPADTTGTIANDNGNAFSVVFWMGAGTDRTSGTLRTTWASTTTADFAVGQTNLAAATNNYWQVTGVQLETGPVATPFEFEPYEATLRKCQRYYYRMTTDAYYGLLSDFGTAYLTTAVVFPIHPPGPMRVKPSAVDYANVTLSDQVNAAAAPTALAVDGNSSTNITSILATGATGLTQYRNYILTANSNVGAYIGISAEL